MAKVAVIGAGLIGRAWAMVFARAGWEVALYDAVAGVAEAGLKSIGEGLRTLAEHGLADDPAGAAARVRAAPELQAALDGASFVQGNVPETGDAQRALFGGPRRPRHAGCGPRFAHARHRGEPVHRGTRRPPSLPRRPPGHPAAPGAAGRTGGQPVDRAEHHRAREGRLPRGWPGADRGAAGDRGLRAQPAAGRAARRGLPFGGRRGRLAAGSRPNREGRPWTALVVP